MIDTDYQKNTEKFEYLLLMRIQSKIHRNK